MFAEAYRSRDLPLFAPQGDGVAVARQTVVIRAIETGEAFELIQCSRRLKGFRIQFDGSVGAVATGAAAGIFLGVLCVRRAVGAEEELGAAAGRSFNQSLAVRFALQYRQTIEMRAYPACQHGVAVVEQVLRREGGGDVGRSAHHKLCGILCGDVFEHHAQIRHIGQQRLHHAVDKHRLAVENIDMTFGDFAVHQQRHAAALHFLQCGISLADIGHARVRIGGRPGRIQLDRMHHSAGLCFAYLGGAGVVGQIKRHQRIEICAGRQCCQNAVAIFHRLYRAGDRGTQVGHDDGAGKLSCGIGQHRLHQCAVAQVQVPVVGAGDGELLHD